MRELHIRKSDGLHSDGFRSFYHTLEFIGGTVRYAAAVIKYCDVCANLFNLLHIMRGVDDCRTVAVKLFNAVKYVVAALRIDCNGRLVQYDQLRFVSYAACNVKSAQKSSG